MATQGSPEPRSRRAASRGAKALIAIITTAILSFAPSAHAQPAPAFTETACDLPNVTAELRPLLRCGTVNVPRNHAHPESGEFRLAVVVVRSPKPADQDPILYISGGPGSPLTIYAAYQAAHPMAPGHDVILVDQRGTGRSQPQLCPDLGPRLLNAELDLVTEATPATSAAHFAAYMDCRAEAIAHGIDLQDFGTTVTVDDLESMRQALAIPRWNVFGVSYGTTVAMTLMTLHPDTLDAVVLDSIYPPEPAPPWSEIVRRAREAFLAVHPGLAETYAQTLDRLDRAPLPIKLPNATRLTRSLFEVLVARLIYYPVYYPSLLALIADVHDGATKEAESALAEILSAARQTNSALAAAVQCRDRRQFRRPAGAGILDQMQLNDICTGWSELGPSPLVPVGTTIPTLILAGQFDPVSGPALSHQVADQIGNNAKWLEIPMAAHSVRSTTPEAAKIVAAFFDHPVATAGR